LYEISPLSFDQWRSKSRSYADHKLFRLAHCLSQLMFSEGKYSKTMYAYVFT
jgi:hypothetical protein